eukprot:m.39029 g.39029  ORF g.39029 m.39029 type:complete len:59 (+) comp6833_c0_seq1:3325-3501(+)
MLLLLSTEISVGSYVINDSTCGKFRTATYNRAYVMTVGLGQRTLLLTSHPFHLECDSE